MIIDTLKSNKTIRNIYLSGNPIDIQDAINLCDVIKTHATQMETLALCSRFDADLRARYSDLPCLVLVNK